MLPYQPSLHYSVDSRLVDEKSDYLRQRFLQQRQVLPYDTSLLILAGCTVSHKAVRSCRKEMSSTLHMITISHSYRASGKNTRAALHLKGTGPAGLCD